MTKEQGIEKAKKNNHLIGKKYQHKGSKKIVQINHIINSEIKGDYQVMVSCSYLIPDAANRQLTEEIDYFLGTYSPISIF